MSNACRYILPVVAFLFFSYKNAFAQSAVYPPPAQVARDFKALLSRPAVDFQATFQTIRTDSVQVEKGAIYTEATERMPVVIYKPVGSQQTRFPVAIFLHGTGGNKDQGDIKRILTQLALKGVMGVAIDARYHGERIAGGAHGSREYTEAAYQAWKNNDATHHNYPFLYNTSYDLWRLVDYLITRPDVKADRIGMGGISMGGIETWMAASVDTRIYTAVVGIAAQSFQWSLDNDQWQGRTGTIGEAHKKAAKDIGDTAVNRANVKAVWDQILPGITGEFDCPSMIRLFAPRPLLILSKDKDRNNPYPGAQIAFHSAEAAYQAQHAADKLKIDVQMNLGHTFNEKDIQLTIEWFSKWLLQ